MEPGNARLRDRRVSKESCGREMKLRALGGFLSLRTTPGKLRRPYG